MDKDNAAEKRDFILPKAIGIDIEDLEDGEVGKLFRAIVAYEIGTPSNIVFGNKTLLSAAFKRYKDFADHAHETYNKACKKKREYGSQGGRPKKQGENDDR